MKEKHPNFVAQLEERGLMYSLATSNEDLKSSFTRRGWKSIYMTDDKKSSRRKAEKMGTKLEWMGNVVKTITSPLPAIRFDKESQRKTWFIDLGNGDLVPNDAMEDCLQILEEECAIIPWRKGDVMLINNFMVLHSRQPLRNRLDEYLRLFACDGTFEMATETFFREDEIPEQKSHGDRVLFPVVLSPNTNTKEANVCVFEEAIKAEKPWLESLLNERGVILFRDFHVTSPSDFNKVVEAFGYPEFVYFGGRAPRTKIVGRVYTANESPLDIRIPFHHEMAYLPDFPKKVFFYCEEEPGEGGETPIVLSHIVYEKMKEKHPDFLAQLEEHGLTYITITGEEDDPSVIGGIGWKTAFMTNDKNVAEERAAELGAKLEWTGKGVKMTTGPLTAIRLHKESQRKTWFYNHGFSNIRPSNIHDHATYLELGNGDLVPDDAIKDCLKIMDEECVAIPWKKGDVMLINNFMALHGRLPLRKPPRRVLASLCK